MPVRTRYNPDGSTTTTTTTDSPASRGASVNPFSWQSRPQGTQNSYGVSQAPPAQELPYGQQPQNWEQISQGTNTPNYGAEAARTDGSNRQTQDPVQTGARWFDDPASWLSNPTGHDSYNNQTYGYNPKFYASEAGAKATQNYLGGGITTIQPQSGPYSGPPQYNIQTTPGGAIQNVGLVQDLYRKYPKHVADQMIADINKYGEGSGDYSGNATYTPYGGQPNPGPLTPKAKELLAQQGGVVPTNEVLPADAQARAAEAAKATAAAAARKRKPGWGGTDNWLFYPGQKASMNTGDPQGEKNPLQNSGDLFGLIQLLQLLGM